MAPPLLTLQDIHLTFGGTPLLEGAELSISEGERLCLVGRNGSGKSTFLKIAAGQIECDSGKRFIQPGTTVRYLPQVPDFDDHKTALDYTLSGLGPGDEPYRAQYLLEQLGLSGAEDVSRLSGGEARRAALARALAPEPDILLLDEPTNHLDLPVIEWLEEELTSLRSAIVLISHDRRFLETISRSTVWLDRGTTRLMNKGFSHFEVWRDEVLELEELEQHKLDRKIVREEHWVRYGVTARRKRNMRRMRELQALRQSRRDHRAATGSVTMTATEGTVSGKLVVEAKSIGKRYADRDIVKDFSSLIQRGDRIGLVGPNGAGKTTLLNMLTGKLPPDHGSMRLGANLQMMTLDQQRSGIRPDWTVKEVLTEGSGDMVEVNGQQRHVIGYMKDFLFAPEQARSPVSALSGGERGRLMLAVALSKPSNFLVLDEPTNDLDLETLELLQEMLTGYNGTVLIVSHDRDFLDRIATSVVVSEGEGRWQEYAGGYSDMVAQRGAGVSALRESAKAEETRPSQPSRKEEDAAKSAKKRKLSFKDKHALETLPNKMLALQNDIQSAESVMADPKLFTGNPEKFQKTMARLSELQSELEACEEQWLELEMLREELEGN
ncbi:MAG: ATP-binding cassette domain-containing protein [Stappiaceae bacterium]